MAIHGKQLKDASIDLTKLEGIAATPTAGQLLVAGANGSMQALNVGGNLTASVTNSTLDLSIAAGTIQLSMIDGDAIVSEAEGIGNNDNDTTIPTSAAVKDYVDNNAGGMSSFIISDGTTSETINDGNTITLNGTANEVEVAVSATDTITIGLPSDVTIGNDLTVTGDLTVNGTTTTVNSTTVQVDDKNIELGVGSANDAAADGGGITLKSGDGDKTLNWVDATDSWTSSEHMDLAAAKEYKIGTTSVLTTDGAAKVQSAVAGDGLAHSAGVLSLDLNELTDVTVDVAADSIAIIDADASNGSRKESIADLATAMAGTGITATNGVLSAASASLKIVSITPSNSLAAGNLIIENGQSSAYTLPSSPSGQLQLSVNGVIQELGAATGQGDYYVDSNDQIEWNSSDFSLDNTDTLVFTYVPA